MTTKTNEGLADLAQRAEMDHEVQMARSDLYKVAKYAIKLHEMLKGVSEAQGIEGWQQSKITKAADYISSVYHALDYDMKFNEGIVEGKQIASCGCDEDSCDHCKGGHSMEEVGDECKCCGNKIKLITPEGKSPHKKGSAKYKKHMAAKHASMAEDSYKSSIAKRLEESLSKKLKESEKKCPDCGKPSYTTLPEEKQKGVDGKVCWKGYKRMGTKKKGGKTVDNCVKM